MPKTCPRFLSWFLEVKVFRFCDILSGQIYENFDSRVRSPVELLPSTELSIISSNRRTIFILDLIRIYFISFIFFISLRFWKAGRGWCGGARETHWGTYHNRVTVSRAKQSLRSSCFSLSYVSDFIKFIPKDAPHKGTKHFFGPLGKNSSKIGCTDDFCSWKFRTTNRF